MNKVLKVQDIYRGQILELAKSARLSEPLAKPTHSAEKNNPICGDKVTIDIVIENEIVSDVHLFVRGCALCEAGAGMLGETAIGKNLNDLKKLTNKMDNYLNNNEPAPDNNYLCFEPVKKIKNRITCVLLAFQAASELTPNKRS